MILHSSRLSLQEFQATDARFLLELVTDPDWIRFIGDTQVNDEPTAIQYIESRLRGMYRRLGFGLWRVFLPDGTPIGMCGLVKRDSLTDVDLGFAFHPRFRGHGYALEAAQRCVAHAEALGLRRLAAITSPENDRSQALLRKLGMTKDRQTRLPGEERETALWSMPLEGSPPVHTTQSLVDQFFAAFDNREGPPRLDSLYPLFAAQGRLVKPGVVPEVLDLPAFITPRKKLLDTDLRDFFERETSFEETRFGRIAHRWSRYEKAGVLRGSPFSQTGTKSFQFVQTPGGWRILSVCWDDDPPS